MSEVLKLSKFDISHPDYCFFLERGRENECGAMTGTVYKIINEGKNCVRYGSYKINKHGEIERFPGVRKEEKLACEEKGLALDELRYSNFKFYCAKQWGVSESEVATGKA
jgi:hypothetical protein